MPLPMTLLLVSNRLPITLRRTGNHLDVEPNPGGVAAGLSSFYREYGARWFGWPGDVSPSESRRVAARLEKEFDCHPIFLPHSVARAYYAGFSNGTLWPLFHSFATYARYSAAEWDAYRDVNERFAAEIVRTLKRGDSLWIHDYHLLLLPRLIREQVPDARIGLFLPRANASGDGTLEALVLDLPPRLHERDSAATRRFRAVP